MLYVIWLWTYPHRRRLLSIVVSIWSWWLEAIKLLLGVLFILYVFLGVVVGPVVGLIVIINFIMDHIH